MVSDKPGAIHNQLAADGLDLMGTNPFAPMETPGWTEARPVYIPRYPTQDMMDAGMYHCSADMEWADLYTVWLAMFDTITLDGGVTEFAPADHEAQLVASSDVLRALQWALPKLSLLPMDEAVSAEMDWACSVAKDAFVAHETPIHAPQAVLSDTDEPQGDLLPCPFCGSMNIDSTGEQVICNSCSSGTAVEDSIDEAIAAWNRRALPAARAEVSEADEPKTHIGRMRVELEQLNDRLGKLQVFLKTDVFEGLHGMERSALRDQATVMAEYSMILTSRYDRALTEAGQ